jgi:hypothetical protein
MSFVYVVCWAGSGLCEEVIASSEESYRLCVCVCVCVSDLETSNSRLKSNFDCSATNIIMGRHLIIVTHASKCDIKM